MECHVCEVRSSVGYCVECQQLLCETCGVPCDNCGKISCAEHIHETRGGRSLCISCYEERREKREQQKKAAADERASKKDTSLAGLQGEAEGEEEIDQEALVLSARRPIQPWLMSVYIALGAIVVALLMFLIPGLRRIPLGGGNFFPSTYVVLIIPILAIVWAAVGLFKEDYYEDRSKCFLGIGLALVASVLTFVAMWTDVAARAKSEADTENVREGMSEQQLEQWREQTLNQYKQQ